jgi:hypothetical protein
MMNCKTPLRYRFAFDKIVLTLPFIFSRIVDSLVLAASVRRAVWATASLIGLNSFASKDKTAAECTKMCVKDGMKHVLTVEKKVYTLEGHEAELAKLAGQKVTVKGTLKGDTLSFRKSLRRNKHQILLDPGIRSNV